MGAPTLNGDVLASTSLRCGLPNVGALERAAGSLSSSPLRPEGLEP